MDRTVNNAGDALARSVESRIEDGTVGLDAAQPQSVPKP